jgi:hypothetical protein
MKKIQISKKIYNKRIGFLLTWRQKNTYELGADSNPFIFVVTIVDANGKVIEEVEVIIPSTIIQNWENDSEITEYILTELGIEQVGKAGYKIRINKEYAGVEVSQISWSQSKPYELDNKSLSNDLFDVFVYNDSDVLVGTEQIQVPYPLLEAWGDDTIITNFILSKLGFELDATVVLLLDKLNSNTINFADGVDAVEAQTILNNYVQFVALMIESFNRGEVDLVNFPTIEQYNPNVQVVINLGTEVFSVLEFAQSLQAAAPAEKQSKLTDCLTNITQL